MKKTFNINLAGVPFIIDDDAYTLLNDYLDTLEHTFRNIEDSQDILNDLESRMTELLLEKTDRASIVTAEMVKEAMARLGRPEEMLGEEEKVTVDSSGETVVEEQTATVSTPPPYSEKLPHIKKRLFRDPQNSILGGVCSGIGWYLGVDATWVRLAMVVLTLVSFSTFCIAYVVLWIVVPAARTPVQRLEMMGEQPTMENIARTVADTYDEEQNPAQAGFSYLQSNNTPVLVRVLIIIGLIIGLPLLLGIALAIIGCIFFLIVAAVTYNAGTLNDWLGDESLIAICGVATAIFSLITLGIPVGILVWKGLSNGKATKFTNRNKKLLLFTWLTSLACTAVMVGIMVHVDKSLDRERRIQRELDRAEANSQGWVETDGTMDDSIFTQAVEPEKGDTVTVSSLTVQKDTVVTQVPAVK